MPNSGFEITSLLHRANTALQNRSHMCHPTLMFLEILLPSLLPWQEWCCLSTFQTPKDSRLSVASHTHSHNGSNSVGAMFSSAPYKHKAVPQQAFANLTLRMPTVFKPFYKTAFISRGVHDIYMGSAWCLAHVLVPDWPALNNDALPLSTDGTITIVMKISNHGNMLTKCRI